MGKYMKMKNDVAYLVSNSMAVYEHQSTVNPNMPLRGFTYFGELYNNPLKKFLSCLIKIARISLLSETLQRLSSLYICPYPQAITHTLPNCF